MVQIRKIYHVELKDPAGDEPKHSYFGSAAAIFDTFDTSRLGISYLGLMNNYRLQTEDYENRHCVIRCGFLQTKKKQQSKHQKDEDRQTER